MRMKKAIVICAAVTMLSGLSAVASSLVSDTVTLKSKKVDYSDGYYKSLTTVPKKVIPLREPNPNNVRMYHRYWRDIDLKDPRNQKFVATGNTVIDALLQGVKDKKLTAYDARQTDVNPGGDDFISPMNYNQLMGQMRDTALINVLDKDGNIVGTRKELNDFNPDKVVGYRIKEDVYYNKQKGKVETRIIGIAPVIAIKTTSGDTLNIQPVCWLKYKDCRYIFANMDISDPDRKIYDISMDDVFLEREFNAKITEESNPRGERIKDYMKTPEDQDKEARRIETKLAEFKSSMWKYRTEAAVKEANNAANEDIVVKVDNHKRRKIKIKAQ
jgi:gliding motility associated protien GldN